MYKNFTLTESEKEQILNHHKQYGYKQPINEGGDKEVIVKQAEDATNMLSPEEKNILANYIQTHGEKSIVNIVKNELSGGEGEFNEEMDEKEFKIRTIIDKIINKTVAASAIGIVPAAMFISGGVGVALGITALVGLTLKDAAWWGGKGPHSLHYKEADKSRKDWYNGKPDIKPTKKYYSDEDEMSEEQSMDELTLGMGDPNFKQSHETKYSPEQQHEMDTISELVHDAVGDSLSSRSIKDIIEDIQADYLNGNMNGGDVYDYVNEYLKDWVRDARSESPSGYESGSRLTGDENGTIWGSDWQSVIDRATQKPEPDDDQIMNGFGREGGISYGSSSGFDGRTMNEAKEILKANFKRFL